VTVPALGGPHLIAVAEGSITATLDGSARLLAAGDQLVARPDQALALANAGEVEAVVYGVWLGRSLPGPADLYDVTAATLAEPIYSSTSALPAGTARVVLERVTLEPEANLVPYEATGREWVGVESGTLGLTLEGTASPTRCNPGRSDATRHH
jgi:hypothetical protein